jgi:hypothetical protein
VHVALAVIATTFLSWVAYLVFLDRIVKRHGPEVLKHVPSAVKVYRASGALAWLEVIGAYFRTKRGGS